MPSLNARTPHGTPSGETEETFEIMGLRYEVIAKDVNEYAVRVTDIENGFHTWIRRPHRRFETLSGARYAILCALELEWSVNWG